MEHLIKILVAIMWWTLVATNTARFVLEVSKHHDITWAAYGYGALAGVAVTFGVGALTVLHRGKK